MVDLKPLSKTKNKNLEIGLIIYEQVFEHLIDIKKELSLLKVLCQRYFTIYFCTWIKKNHLPKMIYYYICNFLT